MRASLSQAHVSCSRAGAVVVAIAGSAVWAGAVWAGVASAATTARLALPWSELSLQPAAVDAAARGPELLRAGPQNTLAVCDPVAQELDVIDVVEPGQATVRSSFPVRLCGDIAWTQGGDLLVLDPAARQLTLVDPAGQLLAAITLPALAPTGLQLAVDDDRVSGLDLFGNAHPLATLSGGQLAAPQEDGLEDRTGVVRWDPVAHTLSTAGLHIDLPQARVASGQLVGDWLIVDAVVAERPQLLVDHQAWHVPTAQAVKLPLAGRLYSPRGEATQDQHGRLVLLDPRADGLGLLWVTP